MKMFVNKLESGEYLTKAVPSATVVVVSRNLSG